MTLYTDHVLGSIGVCSRGIPLYFGVHGLILYYLSLGSGGGSGSGSGYDGGMFSGSGGSSMGEDEVFMDDTLMDDEDNWTWLLRRRRRADGKWWGERGGGLISFPDCTRVEFGLGTNGKLWCELLM